MQHLIMETRQSKLETESCNVSCALQIRQSIKSGRVRVECWLDKMSLLPASFFFYIDVLYLVKNLSIC